MPRRKPVKCNKCLYWQMHFIAELGDAVPYCSKKKTILKFGQPACESLTKG